MVAFFLKVLATERRRLLLSAEDVAAAAGLLVMDVGRIERGDEHLRLDYAVGYAAAVGYRLALSPRTQTPQQGRRVDDAAGQIAGNLDDLRRQFAACREVLKVSPTDLARSCGVTAKAIFALERGPGIPRIASALAHARRFGLELVPVEASQDCDLSRFAEWVSGDLLRPEASPSRSGPAPSYYVKAPRSEMEAHIADALADAFRAARMNAKNFAELIGVDWKTIAPGGTLTFTGRFSTVERIAEALGYRIMAVPNDLDVPSLVGRTKAKPASEPSRSPGMAAGIARRLMQAREGRGLPLRAVAGKGAIKTTRKLETEPANATVAMLCRHAAALGLSLVAVPEAAASRVAAAAEPKAVRGRRKRVAPIGFNKSVDGHKRQLMKQLCDDLDQVANRPATDDLARRLGLRPDVAEGLLDGSRYRSRMTEFVAMLRARSCRLEVFDPDGTFEAFFGGDATAEEEVYIFTGLGIVHRQAQGLTLRTAGVAVGLSERRIEHVESGDPKILATSLLVYAGAIGLSWRVVGPKGDAPERQREVPALKAVA